MLTFGCEHGRRQMQVALAEDFGGLSQVLDKSGSGTTYDPDFAVNVAVAWKLGGER